jgi:hypothetical protein
MINMEWFQNEQAEKADSRIEQLEERHKNRILIKWEPKATSMYSVEQLRKNKIVGIYEISPCEGCDICEKIKRLYDDRRKRIRK